jgi:hypothetical protein
MRVRTDCHARLVSKHPDDSELHDFTRWRRRRSWVVTVLDPWQAEVEVVVLVARQFRTFGSVVDRTVRSSVHLVVSQIPVPELHGSRRLRRRRQVRWCHLSASIMRRVYKIICKVCSSASSQTENQNQIWFNGISMLISKQGLRVKNMGQKGFGFKGLLHTTLGQ